MPTADEKIDEFGWGGLARREGAALTANPHPPYTSLGAAWSRGWRCEDRLLKRNGDDDQ